MNPIQKLLSEQREEFENKFPHKIAEVVDDFGSTCKSDITDYITTAQQQLIDVIIGNLTEGMYSKEMLENANDRDYRIYFTLNEELQTQITLLEEAKKNVWSHNQNCGRRSSKRYISSTRREW